MSLNMNLFKKLKEALKRAANPKAYEVVGLTPADERFINYSDPFKGIEFLIENNEGQYVGIFSLEKLQRIKAGETERPEGMDEALLDDAIEAFEDFIGPKKNVVTAYADGHTEEYTPPASTPVAELA